MSFIIATVRLYNGNIEVYKREMGIRYANINDIDTLIRYDNHIVCRELENSVKLNRVIVSYEDEKFIGWLRYNLFWDNTPFMNMLFIIERERHKGYGEKLMVFWEQEMKRAGHI